MKRNIATRIGAGLILACMPLAITIAGCENPRTTETFDDSSEVGMTLMPTGREVYAGEIITVSAQTRNLLARDAEVRWSTTGGELTTEDDGRLARVKFDRPGRYIISAQLFVDGEMERTEAVTVNVKPLR